MAKWMPVKKFNLSKAADIQPETLLKKTLSSEVFRKAFCLEHFSVAPFVPNNFTNLVP